MIEDLVGETVHQAPRLPHSSTVGATAQLLSELDGFVAAKKGFSVPGTSMRKLSAPNAYAVHSEKWPVKAPQLDPDASRIGIRANPAVHTSWQFVEGVENKLRASVSTLSHTDLFCAAAHKALTSGEDRDCVLSLIAAAAKSARHAMGTAMALSMETLLLRRDSAIAASNLLPGENRDRLRAAPLASDRLFGGLCSAVASEDATQRQREVLVHPAARSRPPGPKGNRGSTTAKAKGPKGVPPLGSRKPSPLTVEEPSASFSRRGRGRGRGASTRGRFSSKGPQKSSH